MEYLEIKADISQQKLNEFNQSKLFFIESLQKIEGYQGFKEKPGVAFEMRIGWASHLSLIRFLKSECYRFFHGAIITLSDSNNIEIVKEQ